MAISDAQTSLHHVGPDSVRREGHGVIDGSLSNLGEMTTRNTRESGSEAEKQILSYIHMNRIDITGTTTS